MLRPTGVVPCLLVLGLLAPGAQGEGPLGSWSPRDLEGMTKRRWEAATNRTAAEILRLNRELKTWPEACEVVAGAKEYAGNREFLEQVAGQLVDPTITRLEKTYRLIHWERIRAGDLVFPGRGFVVLDDVFTVSGRANWILRTVTEKSFGYVKPDAKAEELAALQRTWRSFLAGENPPEHAPPYRAEIPGLEDELFDPLAIEVLVRSLGPSPGKDALIRSCLDKVGKPELPTDPNDPAALCDPDVFARIFLRQATDVQTDLPAEAWAAWWSEHRDHLRFNPKSGKFESGAPAAPSE